jgi:purine-binding chemotaxis protein CheW
MSADGLGAAEAIEDRRAARILRMRAQRLAAAPADEHRADELEVLRCRVGDEEYALPLGQLIAIQRAEGLTPVPCTPPHVAGLLNVRGELITVLDLGVALRVRAAPSVGAGSQVLLVEAPHGRVGLLVDEALGMDTVMRERLTPALSSRDFASGVVDAHTVLLAVDRLLADERFEVDEEVT